MNGFCAHCGKKMGKAEVVDYDTDKQYCGRECFNKRARRRPLEYPISMDDDDFEEFRAVHP